MDTGAFERADTGFAAGYASRCYAVYRLAVYVGTKIRPRMCKVFHPAKSFSIASHTSLEQETNMASHPAVSVYRRLRASPQSGSGLSHDIFRKNCPQAWIACSGVESTENPSVWLLALLQQACRSFEPLRSRNQGPLAGEGCTSSLIRMTSGSALYLTHRDSTS